MSMRWYIVHAYSNFEKKVAEQLRAEHPEGTHKVMRLDTADLELLGRARTVTVTKDDTTIVEGAGGAMTSWTGGPAAGGGRVAPESPQRPGGEEQVDRVEDERGRLLLIPVCDIIYLKADLKYVTARTASREYLLDESLTHLEEEFSERFIRLHRSALVAKDAIAGFEKGAPEDGEQQWQALLRGISEKLPVSRRQWAPAKALIKHS